jgi:hypothetical protein
MTKIELARELLASGVVKESEAKPEDYDDPDLAVIVYFLLFPRGNPSGKAPDPLATILVDLETALFLANKSNDIGEWMQALFREVSSTLWKFFQQAGSLTPEQMKVRDDYLKRLEDNIESEDQSTPPP